jgi:hypothetical protein
MLTDPVILNPVMEPRFFKTVKVKQGSRQEIVFDLTDQQGNCLDLSSVEPVQASQFQPPADGLDGANPGFPDGIQPKGAWPDVAIRFVASRGPGQPNLIDVLGAIVDFKIGRVVFHLIPENLCYRGIFQAEIGLFRGDLLQASWPVYLSIEGSLFAPPNQGNLAGMLTIGEIRLALRDLDASYNDVLDDVEFKDSEIMRCITIPVNLWNEMLPPEPSLRFTYDRFPFREEWLRATTGYLLEMAAHWYRRNDVPVSAGGIQVNDRNKHLTYEPKAKELISEFKAWAKQYKAALSARMAFGSVRSNWPQGGYGWR